VTNRKGLQNLFQTPPISWKQLCSYLLIFLIVPIATFVVGRQLDSQLGLPPFPPFPLNFLFGFSVFFGGLALGITSTRLLYRVGGGLPWGELDSKAQSAILVTSGVYAFSRNPMTLGYSALPCGMGLMFHSLSMTLVVPTVVLTIMVIWLKVWEEPNLDKRFGAPYRAYQKRTPFLIPHPKALIAALFSR